MTTPLLDAGQRAAFARDGVLVLRGFYDLEAQIRPVQRAIHAVVGEVITRHGLDDDRGPCVPERFDDGYLALVARDRRHGGEVYDAVKQVPAFFRLVGDPRHDALMTELRPGALPGIAAGGHGIRIDLPGEEKYRANWHQEYPSQLRSLDGLVLWSPLVPITPERGPVRIALGSHRGGVRPVTRHDPRNPDKQGAYGLTLHDEERLLAGFEIVAPLTEPGDLVVMDFLTLHESGRNASDRARWSMQFRYFNFREPVGRGHGWKGSFAAGVDFAAVHPEFLVEPSA